MNYYYSLNMMLDFVVELKDHVIVFIFDP